MVAPTLADLRYAFYGAGGQQSVSDAEYEALLALYQQGAEPVTLAGLVNSNSIVDLRTGVASDWQRTIITPDLANVPDSAVSFEHGSLVIRAIGGTGVQSNRREAWKIPGVQECTYGRIKSLWNSRPGAAGALIENAHFHRLQLGADGKNRAIVVWDFGGAILCGVWEALPDGTSSAFPQAPLRDSEAVSAASRTSNVVTLTVPAGANTRWAVDDAIVVDLTDNTYDGTFAITGVTSTTITYNQTAADDPSGGTGTATLVGAGIQVGSSRNFALTDAVRAGGIVTSVGLIQNHPIVAGDWIGVDMTDATYDMSRAMVTGANIFTQQITWLQPGVADDASAGAGTITHRFPFWVESELLPGEIFRVRVTPDFGGSGIGLAPVQGIGNVPGTPQSPWEGMYAATFDMNRITGATLPTGAGALALGAAHHSSVSPISYSDISASPLYYNV